MFRRLVQWLRENIVSIVLAMLLAFTVWIVASLEVNPPENNTLAAPVEIAIVGLEPGLVITNDYTNTTRVRLRAFREGWRSLSAEDVTATADLSGLGPGTHQVAVEVVVGDNVQATYLSANPQSIRIELQERFERTNLPIQLALEGEPAIGFSQGEATATPALASVEGPRQQVDLISEIQAVVSIDGARETVEREVTLVALDSDGSEVAEVTITPARVRVSVPVVQEAGFRDIAVIVRTAGRPAPGYYVTSILPTPQRLTVRGDPLVIEAMQPYAETEVIDLTNLTDDLIREVILDLPPGVTPIGSPTIEVLISIAAQLSSRTVLAVPLQAIGLGEDLVVEFSPAEVDVILSGPLTLLDALDPETDIQVVINVTGREPGTYQIEPEVRVSQRDILVESVLPIVIEVMITLKTDQG